MKKATFNYKKDDGTISDRIVFKPNMLKEVSNSLKSFDNPNVNYLNGYELDKKGMDSNTIDKYDKIIEEYFEIIFPTLEDFLIKNGLDPSKINQKSFKKVGIDNLQLL